jgi:phospholipase C
MRVRLHGIVVFSAFWLAAGTGTAFASPPCPLSQTNPSVTVCTPSPNALVQSEVNVVAGSTDSNAVTAMQIYLDNKLVYQVHAPSLNAFVTLPVGYHLITVQGWDSTGATFKSNVPVAMQPPCALNATNRTVTVCSLISGSIVSQPFHVVAAATDSSPVTSMTLLIDGANKGNVSDAAILDLYVSNMTLGVHSVAVQAKDSTGAVFQKSFSITVTAASKGLSKLRHIIFFLQENRSFDNYFGMLGRYRVSEGLPNNVDGLNLNTTLPNTQGQPVHPFHYQTVCSENLSPAWNESHVDVDGGLMDGFMQTSTSVASSIDPTGTRAMGYYDQTDIPYYYEAAARFATSDRFFSPELANTIPNRLYLFTATSFGNAFPPNTTFESITQPTIFAHLDQAGVSWRYYYQGSSSSAFIQQFSVYKTDASKVVPIANWFNDIQNDSTLPSVIFIERAAGTDEHPGANIQTGAAFAANVINALLKSPSWNDSALILAYDEGGGLYDHVRPAREVPPDSLAPKLSSTDKPGAFNQTGFRVPLIIFSPWARRSFVSHTARDYTSILRLIEDRFNVAPLTLRDANADNMMEFFNFSGAAPLLTPPTLPPQPTNGVCDNTKEKAPGF